MSNATNVPPRRGQASPTLRPRGNRGNRAAQAAFQARRKRNRLLGFGAIAATVIVVIALVIVKVAGSSGSTSAADISPPAGTPVAAATMEKLTSVPLSVLAAAPSSAATVPPSPVNGPPLAAAGKPELLYIGAEYCPICAAERWAMVVALSKFGTFSPAPGQIHSAVRDGNIPTLTFYGTTYSSPYLTFTPVETTTNQPKGNFYVTLQTPTSAQQQLWVTNDGGESFPWVDFGGKAQLQSAQYNPQILEGQSFDGIAAQVGNNSTNTGAAIDASAKVLVQQICAMTGDQPASTCHAVGSG